MMSTIAAIALGGAFGAILRYSTNIAALKVLGDGFPWATLSVNVIGSFLMGVCVVVFAHVWQPSYTMKVFLTTGVLGAFTTFSTFSLDVSLLWDRAQILPAVSYILASVVFSISALFLAMAITRSIVS